jgi:hypothetical protein
LLPATRSRLLLVCTVAAASFVAGCTAAMGPGYSIEKQEIDVHFISDPQQPAIHIDCVYHLRNDGNQPLTVLEIRLPGRRRFHAAEAQAEWDGQAISFQSSPDNTRNVVLNFPEPWTISANHTLRLSADYHPAPPGEHTFSFTPDAFFLPAEGWSPQLLPARGAFATGGVPPSNWVLTVQVPENFLVHASGRKPKISRSRGQQTVRIQQQQAKDGYPFVIAGHYIAAKVEAPPETVNLWSRGSQNTADLRKPAAALVTAMHAYDAMFGARSKESHQLWMVECPVVENCFTGTASRYAQLVLEEGAKPAAEMSSRDTVMIDLTSGAPQIVAAAGPSLASSWLGYGQSPGFFEQDPPLAALPAFAAVQGREAVQGSQIRSGTIRRILARIPTNGDPRKPETDEVVRGKSLLFFFALQDRYGENVFDRALNHMLYARQGGGFDLDDLIASFEQESHQNVAEFVRHWMKRPGVPEDFRTRYETSAAAVTSNSKETRP